MSRMIAAVLGLALLPITAVAMAGQQKVLVCHNGNTLSIAAPALDAHLGHGDDSGPCTVRPAPNVPVQPIKQIHYHYLYYPDAEVYFDTDRTLYFYRDDGRWVSADRLPQRLAEQLGEFITLERAEANPAGFHADPDIDPPWLRGTEAVSRYLYYPDAEVYFDPDRLLYFYRLEDRWIAAPTLRDGLRDGLRHFIEIGMRTARPYDFHPDIAQVYGSYDTEPLVEPLPGERRYHYRYYPDNNLYYDEVRDLYFQQEADRWVSTPTLEQTLLNALGAFITMTLDTPDPYERHQGIMNAYRAGAMQPHQALYDYRYYPEQNIYYDPARSLYYHLSDNHWQGSPTRPPALASDAVGLLLQLATDRPYRYHHEIMHEYAAPAPNRAVAPPTLRRVEINLNDDDRKGMGKATIKYRDDDHERGKGKDKDKEKHKHKEEHGKGKGKDH